MKAFLQLSAALCCLSLGWLAYRASLAADAVTRAATEVPQAVVSIVQPALGIVDARTAYVADLLAVNLARLDQLANKTEADANQSIKDAVTVADRRTSDALAIVKDGAANVIAEVQGLRADLKPTLENVATATANTAAITAHADKAVVDLHPQLLGLVAASKVTAGQTAQTMREVERALPPMLSDVKLATAASAEASQATARTMGNLERATRPLPAWVRIPLSITGAIAPTAAGAVSAAAATGAFK